jgi:hypothetical protein
MDEQLEFVKLIASRLDSVGIPYMMTGSMAMAIYSVPRMTRDIDLVVEVKPIDVDKIVSLFSKDCYIDRDSVRQAVDAHSMFNIIHNEWVVKADFIIRKDEEYRREEFARRQKVVIEDMTIRRGPYFIEAGLGKKITIGSSVSRRSPDDIYCFRA